MCHFLDSNLHSRLVNEGSVLDVKPVSSAIANIPVVMVALWNRADHYIFMLWFVLSSFFPRLISAAADWMSVILPHMVWPKCEFKM